MEFGRAKHSAWPRATGRAGATRRRRGQQRGLGPVVKRAPGNHRPEPTMLAAARAGCGLRPHNARALGRACAYCLNRDVGDRHISCIHSIRIKIPNSPRTHPLQIFQQRNERQKRGGGCRRARSDCRPHMPEVRSPLAGRAHAAMRSAQRDAGLPPSLEARKLGSNYG